MDAAKKVYGSLRNGFYGLQATLLTLAFMVLLRIKTPEQLKEKSPGELGIILGLDRIPEVKTLRRKLKEMGLHGKAAEYMAELTRRWCDDDQEAIGFIYISKIHTCRIGAPVAEQNRLKTPWSSKTKISKKNLSDERKK